MVFVRDFATVSRPCVQCGRRVVLRPDEVLLDGPVFCDARCVVAAGLDPVDVAVGGPAAGVPPAGGMGQRVQRATRLPRQTGPAVAGCEVCGGPRSGRGRVYGLTLCHWCRSAAYLSCWRKVRYPQRPPRRITEDVTVLWPYHCPLCGDWHYTSIPGAMLDDRGFQSRIEAIAERFAEIGFDLNTARGWAPTPTPRPLSDDE